MIEFFPNECVFTAAPTDRNGYGRVSASKPGELAHRISYRLFLGDIPDGMCVCHSCDNPACINPKHLWLGSQADNVADMSQKGRNNQRLNEWSTCGIMARLLMADEPTQKEVGNEYGVVQSVVGKIWNRQIRGWLFKGERENVRS